MSRLQSTIVEARADRGHASAAKIITKPKIWAMLGPAPPHQVGFRSRFLTVVAHISHIESPRHGHIPNRCVRPILVFVSIRHRYRLGDCACQTVAAHVLQQSLWIFSRRVRLLVVWPASGVGLCRSTAADSVFDRAISLDSRRFAARHSIHSRAGFVVAGGANGGSRARIGWQVLREVLAAICVALAPQYLSNGSLLGTNSLEPNLWMGCAYFAIAAIKRTDAQQWLWFGVVAGIGLEEKYTIVLFCAGVIVGLLLTAQRRFVLNRWFWLGALAALLIFLPNLIWNYANDWPFLQLMQAIKAEGRDVVLSPVDYFVQQMLLVDPLTAPLWLAGLAALLIFRISQAVSMSGLVLSGLLRRTLLVARKKLLSRADISDAARRRRADAGACAYDMATATSVPALVKSGVDHRCRRKRYTFGANRRSRTVAGCVRRIRKIASVQIAGNGTFACARNIAAMVFRPVRLEGNSR